MAAGTLKVATCQFAVSSSIKRNARQIQNYMMRAKKARAEIVHFSEGALSGCADFEFSSFDGFDWQLLQQETAKIMSLAAKLGLWVVLGSAHRLTPDKNIRGQAGPNKPTIRVAGKPHNSLYLINPKGKIADRYDKRFCMRDELRHYAPGDRFVKFTINGVRCSLLICFEVRFPELYRELYKRGVDCIFQSFYNARQKGPSVHTHIMRQSMQCRAATNYLWVSMTNSSRYYCPYPSCFIRPDGKIVQQLRANRAGLMVNKVDLKKKFYDPMKDFREQAINGKLNNASKTIKDARSRNTAVL